VAALSPLKFQTPGDVSAHAMSRFPRSWMRCVSRMQEVRLTLLIFCALIGVLRSQASVVTRLVQYVM
jgi:hypothetical protein